MKLVLPIVLAVLFFLTFLLEKALRSISAKELKRRARSDHDRLANRLYKTAAYGASAEIFLWIVGGASLGALLIVLGNYTWLVIIVVLLATRLLWNIRPLEHYGNFWWKIASLLALPVATVLSFLQPLLGRLNQPRLTPSRASLYQKEDLLELLKAQNRQADNQIPPSDLKLAFHALQFGDKSVGSVMKPRKTVMWVSEDEPIGPLLMDELHASGQTSFPVVKGPVKKSIAPEAIGTLYLTDLVDRTAGGKVRDVVRRDVYFINESDSLREALSAFIKTHHHLLIVVNNFVEIVGVLTLDSLLEQVLGEKIASEFERYDDKKAVAGREDVIKEPIPESISPAKAKKP